MAARPSSPAGGTPPPVKPGVRAKLVVLSAAASAVLALLVVGGGDDEPTTVSSPPVLATASAPPAGQPATKHLPRSKPVRLRIPEISVDAPFVALSIGPSGQLEPPPADDVNLVGWHAAGPSPGERGTSIIAGHVDTATSPAVFVDLGELEKGDVFHVDRADGRRATFVVDSVETFDKDEFPDQRVYADTEQAQVRLITCAGDYDRTVKDYTDNLVVFAHLT
ncbi:class F sortase [Streptomyces sp. enrichment culture]|uniref:class F sortase n=1 Tax=Streptomyces sp. enrichment culture TaxID=1795815 RepID=UPI003F566554